MVAMCMRDVKSWVERLVNALRDGVPPQGWSTLMFAELVSNYEPPPETSGAPSADASGALAAPGRAPPAAITTAAITTATCPPPPSQQVTAVAIQQAAATTAAEKAVPNEELAKTAAAAHVATTATRGLAALRRAEQSTALAQGQSPALATVSATIATIAALSNSAPALSAVAAAPTAAAPTTCAPAVAAAAAPAAIAPQTFKDEAQLAELLKNAPEGSVFHLKGGKLDGTADDVSYFDKRCTNRTFAGGGIKWAYGLGWSDNIYCPDSSVIWGDAAMAGEVLDYVNKGDFGAGLPGMLRASEKVDVQHLSHHDNYFIIELTSHNEMSQRDVAVAQGGAPDNPAPDKRPRDVAVAEVGAPPKKRARLGDKAEGEGKLSTKRPLDAVEEGERKGEPPAKRRRDAVQEPTANARTAKALRVAQAAPQARAAKSTSKTARLSATRRNATQPVGTSLFNPNLSPNLSPNLNPNPNPNPNLGH